MTNTNRRALHHGLITFMVSCSAAIAAAHLTAEGILLTYAVIAGGTMFSTLASTLEEGEP